ncbi:MAG: SpoIVB peptidase [Clostridiaceae bacterium]|nr:SpoIVB peptidase [Clostridiaceae bacterium]
MTERCGCMNRLKVYRACLWGALVISVATLFFYCKWYLQTRVPDVIRVGTEEELQVVDLGFKQVSVQTLQRPRVIPGGIPVGIYLETDGVYVVGTAVVETEEGLAREPAGSIVQSGDYILAVNGCQINTKEELIRCVQEIQDEIMILKLKRGDETLRVRLQAVETEEGAYKLGIWVKDDVQGIGTLTYATRQGAFGALGHGITDTDTGKLLTVSGGMLYDTSILKIVRGQRGTPGELSGMITYSDSHAEGVIRENTSRGIFGQAEGRLLRMLGTETVEVAFKQEVRTGRAVLRSSVSGELKDYEIQIQELRMNESDVNKGMIFYVTDPDLLTLTGGVIQGMSGSPILQNGRLIGAVTHVFVNDPAKGYGIFSENMIEH